MDPMEWINNVCSKNVVVGGGVVVPLVYSPVNGKVQETEMMIIII
jgi:hypothetical protein